MRDHDRYAAAAAASPFEGDYAKIRRRHVLRQMEPHGHRRILEIGCGPTPLFEDAVSFDEFTCVEAAPAFASAARVRAGTRPDVTVVAAEFPACLDVLRTRRYDFIVVSSVLHEVGDVAGFLTALRSLAAVNTVIHVNVPHTESLHRRLGVELGLLGSTTELSETQRLLQQGAFFSRQGLRAAVETAGFTVVAEGGYFVKPFAHAQMAQIVRAGVLDERMMTALDALGERLPELATEIFVDLKKCGV